MTTQAKPITTATAVRTNLEVAREHARCAYSGLFGPTWWWRARKLIEEGIPGGATPLHWNHHGAMRGAP